MRRFKSIKVFMIIISFLLIGCQMGSNGANGLDGKDGISIVWLGSFASEKDIYNPKILNAYFNTTDGCSYIYDGTKWVLLAKAGMDSEDGIDGQDGKDGISIVWLGSFASAKEIENPKKLNAYFNTTDGCSYIYDGTKWTLLAKSGRDSEDGEDGQNGISIVWLGSFASEEEIENPKVMNAYYNTTDGCSYIYNGTEWTLLAKSGRDSEDGEDGQNGLSIVWLGSFASEEEIEDPKKLNAYFNTTDGCSYIYDGTKWTLLAKAGTDGKDGRSDNNEEIQKNENLYLSLPNDTEDTVILTNDFAPVKVTMPPAYQITKVVWKKGSRDDVINPSVLIDDTEAQPVIVNFSNTGIFNVPENGWYDVVAKDSLGRLEWNHIEVKTIDKTPLGEVKQLTAATKDRFVTINWKDISSKEKYDSPIKSVKISYIYNDDENDTNNGELFVDAGVETANITIPRIKTANDFIRITVQTVDEVGNISTGNRVQTWCSNQIYATEANFADRLKSMTSSGEIAVVGECDISIITSALRELQDEEPDIMVDLDLSEVIGWMTIGGNTDSNSFWDCKNLSGIKLPDSLTSLDGCAFGGTSITSIQIPDGVTTIGAGAFSHCERLESVKLPKNLSYLGEQSLCCCYSLSEIIIPKSVNRLAFGVFYGIEGSINIIFEDTETIWYKTRSSQYKNGKEIGSMVGENIKEIFENNDRDYKYYSEKYQLE